MLNRVWAAIQAMTIIALVYSPLFTVFIPDFSQPDTDFGPESNATEYADIEIYSVIIEEPEQLEEKKAEASKPVKKAKKKKPKKKRKAKKTKKSPSKTLTTKNKIAKTGKVLNTTIEKQAKVEEQKEVQKKPRKKRKASRSRCKTRPQRSVKSVGKRKYAIKKKSFDFYVNSIPNAKKLAKAYWYEGKYGKGIMLKSIPCKSPLRNLGVKPKDIIIAVNGKKINNNADLLHAYVQLKTNKNIDILLKRNASRFTLRYEIMKSF